MTLRRTLNRRICRTAGALWLVVAAFSVASAGAASAAPVLGVSVGHLSDEVQAVQIKAGGGTYRLAYADPFGAKESTGGAGTGTLTALSTTIESVATTQGAFLVGEAISGPKIPVGTTISAVNPAEHKITLSAPVEAGGSATGASLVSDLTVAGSFATIAQRMQAALNAIPVLNAGGGSVTVRPGNNQFPYEVVFDGGPLANTNVAELEDSPGFTPLTEGSDINTKVRSIFVWTERQGAIIGTGERLDYLLTVGNSGSSATSGPVTLEFSLPGGVETKVFSLAPIPGEDWEMGSSSNPGGSNGWTCSWQQANGGLPAKVTCTRSDPLAAGASYPSLRIVTFLGADALAQPTAEAVVSGGSAATATTDNEVEMTPIVFGVPSFNAAILDPVGQSYTQAGGHPFSAKTAFSFENKRSLSSINAINQFEPAGQDRRVVIDTPAGFVGNALATPVLCPSAENPSACPAASAVGGIDISLKGISVIGPFPVYAIKPEFGLPAQFAFQVTTGEVFTFFVRLRPKDGYAISFESSSNPVVSLRSASVTLCDFGAKREGSGFAGCRSSAEALTADPNAQPLITNPTRCAGEAPLTRAGAESYEEPGVMRFREYHNPPLTDCEEVNFEPQAQLIPTSNRADSPTGLDVEVTMPTDGVEDPTKIAQANLDNVTVTLPEGMGINSAAADGLGSCSEEEVGLGNNDDPTCPESSKVGTVSVDTPILEETLTGNVYLAKQRANPFHSTLGLYLVFSSKKYGVTIKVPGELEVDPNTGRITSHFIENPQYPFSKVIIHFNAGPHAPLINPPKCGEYAINSKLSPWSAADPANPDPSEVVSVNSLFVVNEGPNGGPCPSGQLTPKLRAGVSDTTAGTTTPFVMSLSREDGSDRFTALGVTTPPGLSAYLKGVPYCPDAAIAGISDAEETGRAELASPSCPAASQIGTVSAGAGAGPFPFYAAGKAYLAGPYKGAPLSIVIVTPAVAGPFDFGSVVVRNALYVNRSTAQVSVKSDPIPTLLHGIILNIRDIRINIDRQHFTSNPTSCDPSAIVTDVKGESGATATVSNRFQARSCGNLGFQPKLTAKVTGPTRRGGLPAFTAELTAPPGQFANLKDAQISLPHSEFLEQAHINTICTRVQAAAHECPAGSIYGYAEAETPLLDGVLKGPVFLKSSDHKLPDLAIALRGPDSQPIEAEFQGRIDSVHGQIRDTIEGLPDVPVSRFVLKMKGGKKGLLTNSRDLCKSKPGRLTINLTAQNNKLLQTRPRLGNSCGQGKSKKKRPAPHRRRAGMGRVLLW